MRSLATPLLAMPRPFFRRRALIGGGGGGAVAPLAVNPANVLFNAGDWSALGKGTISGATATAASPGAPITSTVLDARSEAFSYINNWKTNGTPDFTGEFWIYLTAWDGNAVVLSNLDTYLWEDIILRISTAGAASWSIGNVGGLNAPNGLIGLNAWHNIVIQRSGSEFRMWVDGTNRQEITSANSISNSTYGTQLRKRQNSGESLRGYYGPMRLTRGEALYASNSDFTPAVEYPLQA